MVGCVERCETEAVVGEGRNDVVGSSTKVKRNKNAKRLNEMMIWIFERQNALEIINECSVKVARRLLAESALITRVQEVYKSQCF